MTSQSRKALKKALLELKKDPCFGSLAEKKNFRAAVYEYMYRQQHGLPWDNRPAYGLGRAGEQGLRKMGLID